MNIPVVYDDKVLQQKHEEIFKVLKIDKTKKELLDAKLVITIFDILYKQDLINEREYKALVLNTNRTFNINNNIWYYLFMKERCDNVKNGSDIC